MNNKILTFFLTALFVGFLPFISHVVAQETGVMKAMPFYNGSTGALPFGQTHSYTVTFRGNAEAIVSMKAIFTNYEEATTSAMTFQIPKGKISDISAFQVVQEPQCIQYDYNTQPTQYNATDSQNEPQTSVIPKCLQYSEPNYYGGYYGNVSYLKANIYNDGKTITVYLPQEVGPQKSGSLVLYYRATGYVKKDMYGAFSYSFETLKSDTIIRNLTVGINTDTDLKLEGTDANVNYQTFSVAPMATQDSAKMGSSFTSPEFDSYYQQIGYGSITKTASDLQPFDTFTVTGRYAKSSMQLYGKKIVIGSLLGLGILLLLIAGIHRLIRSFSNNRVTTTSASKTQIKSPMNSVLILGGVALLSSLLTTVYTIGLYVFFMVLNRGYYSDLNIVITLFIVLISCVIYLVIIFGPSIFVGWKRGVWWGVGTLTTTVVFLCIFVGMVMLYTFFMNRTRMYPSPVYMNSVSPTMESMPPLR
ncbi:hypothetical protein BH09PAT2_BH09PAT2_10160 [soil metagenome]